MMPDISDHSLPPLEFTVDEVVSGLIREHLPRRKSTITDDTETALRETEQALRDKFGKAEQ